VKTILDKIGGFFTHKYTSYFVFWGYNAVYLGYIVFTAVTSVSLSFFLRESIPWNIALMVYLLLLVPVGAIFFGVSKVARQNPGKLMSFLFAIEIPVVFFALFRLAFIRQMTGFHWLLFLSLVVAATGLLYHLLKTREKHKNVLIGLALSQEIAVITGFYLLLLILFFLPVIIAVFVKGLLAANFGYLFHMIWISKGLMFFSLFFGVLLFVITIGFFIISPVLAAIIYWKSFREISRELVSKFNFQKFHRIKYAFAAVFILAGVLLSFQFSAITFSPLIQQYKNSYDFEEQQKYGEELAKNDRQIRNLLLNEYLAPYRYFADNNSSVLRSAYKSQFNLPEPYGDAVQSTFNFMASPFVYGRSFKDGTEAVKNYEEIYDMPMQKGERDALVSALGATNNSAGMRAGIIDEKKDAVRLVSRKIAATTENNNLARVTVEEEYENTTSDLQEVYYEFSLPEDAVITGLWLGPDLEYDGVIAPKGAARKTYEQQIRYGIDPALLEQVGPRQYRLRVFPVMVKKDAVSAEGMFNTRLVGPNQKVKFEYVTFIAPEGIPTPETNVSRNIFADSTTKTEYLVNGNENPEFKIPVDYCSFTGFSTMTDAGLYKFVPYKQDSYKCATASVDAIPAISGKKIAMLFDTSYSSKKRDWAEYLKKELPIEKLAENNEIDGYYFSDMLSKPIKLTPESLKEKITAVHIGSTNRLKAINSVPAGYDAIFVFSDNDDSDKAVETSAVKRGVPIFMVHEGGLPQYRDDLTLAVEMSHGGAFNNAKDAMVRLAQTLESKSLDAVSLNRYGMWVIEAGEGTPIPLSKNGDSLMAGAQAIKNLMTDGETAPDAMHVIAGRYGIVSPYSSYVALVNDFQKQQLKRESDKTEKFNAEYDTGLEQLSTPASPNFLPIGGVPEPEEWALLIVVASCAGYFSRKQLWQLISGKN